MSYSMEKFGNQGMILPNHPGYDDLRKVFNRSIDRKPPVIFIPRSIDSLCQALQYALDRGLKVSVRSGGHSAYGQCMADEAILIDMQGFRNIVISPDGSSVEVGGGVLSGELDKALAPFHKAVPLGDCPGVGVCGLALGGGNGLLSRKFGLTCDHLIEIELMTANGDLIYVNRESHPDLFRAMKGAGQNHFGIVTRMKFKLVSPPHEVSTFNYFWNLDQAPEVLGVMESLLKEYDGDLCLCPRFNSDFRGQPGLRIYGISLLDPDISFRINAVLEKQSGLQEASFRQSSYYEAQQINVSSISQDISFHWENAFIPERLRDDLGQEIVECIQDCPNLNGRINLDPVGGAIATVREQDSMFLARHQGYILSVIGVCSGNRVDTTIKDWTTKSAQRLFGQVVPFRYQNYANPSYSLTAYFGPHVQHLQSLKKAYDPAGLFIGLVK